jgi:creatinine amidohydrolase
MSEPHTHQWSAQTWPEILNRVERGEDAAILPIGATEQHGPHLGVGMDHLLAEALAEAVGEAVGVAALPALNYSCSGAHSHRWPGTIALSPTTMIALLTDVGDWLFRSGIRRLFFLNCHVGNKSAIGCAVDMLRCRYDDLMLANFNVGELSPELTAEFTKDGGDWHANAAETSLMQYLAPEVVREDQLEIADDPDRTGNCVFLHPVNRTSSNGVTGRPSEATPAAGKCLFEALVAELVRRIRAGLLEKPPLEASFFKRIRKNTTT